MCVVLDDDPGRDLGMLRQPGHRFFFDLDEVEPLPPEECTGRRESTRPRMLIAGIGNIFMGDDAFGVEVVRRLSNRPLPESVRVVDFGIRGLDLAYALQDGYEFTILVDACPRGEKPGTIYAIEPDMGSIDDSGPAPAVDAHSMDPMKVLRLARSMNADVKSVVVVGCEPATLGGEQGYMGLSEPVATAVDEAVAMIESLVDRALQSGRMQAIL